MLYEDLKEFDKAIKAFTTSLEDATADSKPHRVVNLAEAYARAGQTEGAHSAHDSPGDRI
jgi:hypothetical protein